jgi:hypothetical protein
MNLHPIFVHFPIALLTLYALLELARFKKLAHWEPFFYIKMAIVFFGSLGTLPSLMSGEAIEHQFETGNLGTLVETHAAWATGTAWLFFVITLGYLITWVNRTGAFPRATQHRIISPFWKLLTKLGDALIKRNLVVALALIGLFAVTVTGALGGAIAYGPDIDPAAQFFYNLLIK